MGPLRHDATIEAGRLRHWDRIGEIAAPTLIVGGGRARFYPPEQFRETANSIPDARLVLYENRAHGGTFADRRFGRDVMAFLKAMTSRVALRWHGLVADER